MKQEDNDGIAGYLKKTSDLSSELVQDDIEVGMATLRGVLD